MLGDFQLDGRAVNDLVGRISKFDKELVRPWGKALNDERLTARIDPMPGRIINGNVKVAYPGRNAESGRSEDRHDSQVLSPVANDDQTLRQLLGKR